MAKAHGLDGALAEPDWAPLTLREVRSLLSQYPDCGEPVKILSASPRPFSAASVVAVRGASGMLDRVFVKRHCHAVRDGEGLVEEHRFMAHLLAKGANVPRVMRTASGASAAEDGGWTYEVHDVPQGVDLYRDALSWTPFRCAGHAHAAGQAMARLHCASNGYDAASRDRRPLVASFTIFAGDDPHTGFQQYIAARPALADRLRGRTCGDEALAMLSPFHAELRPLLPELQPLWTHNDLHASNLLWSDEGAGAGVAAVIDFGLADRTCAVHDIAHAIERNIVEWLALGEGSAHERTIPVHLDHLAALLDGYESVRKLSDAEAAALTPMTALCHAEFALSEADYFLSVLHSEEKAAMACDGWLLRHAHWFHTPQGLQLLGGIRRWAEERPARRQGAALEGVSA